MEFTVFLETLEPITMTTVIWEILVLKIISVLIIQGDLFSYFSASFTV